MSDLRTRIAAVLEIHLQGSHEDGFDTEEVLALADAVIRELHLETVEPWHGRTTHNG